MDENDDRQLVLRYLSGERAAFDALVRRYLRPIARIVGQRVPSAADAEDVVQEVFVRAWRGLRSFDHTQSFRPWIFQIARHAAIDALRKVRAAPHVVTLEQVAEDGRLVERGHGGHAAIGEWLMSTDDARALTVALEQLPSRYRVVIILRHRNQLTFREIAESLHDSIDTVKSHHRRALARLHRALHRSVDGAVLGREEAS